MERKNIIGMKAVIVLLVIFWASCTPQGNSQTGEGNTQNDETQQVTPGEACTAHSECSTYLCSGGSCATCSTDSDCTESTGYCNSTAGRCVFGFNMACSSDSDCRSGSCIDGACAACGGLTQEEANRGCAIGVCNRETGRCVDCIENSNCSGNNVACVNEICVAQGCTKDLDCELDVEVCSQSGNCIPFQYCYEGMTCNGGLSCVSGVCR